MATPLMPDPYTPLTYRGMQDMLSEALADHIERRGMTAPQIASRWPTCRGGHLKALRADDNECQPLGLKMLLQLAEATGLRVELKVSA